MMCFCCQKMWCQSILWLTGWSKCNPSSLLSFTLFTATAVQIKISTFITSSTFLGATSPLDCKNALGSFNVFPYITIHCHRHKQSISSKIIEFSIIVDSFIFWPRKILKPFLLWYKRSPLCRFRYFCSTMKLLVKKHGDPSQTAQYV